MGDEPRVGDIFSGARVAVKWLGRTGNGLKAAAQSATAERPLRPISRRIRPFPRTRDARVGRIAVIRPGLSRQRKIERSTHDFNGRTMLATLLATHLRFEVAGRF